MSCVSRYCCGAVGAFVAGGAIGAGAGVVVWTDGALLLAVCCVLVGANMISAPMMNTTANKAIGRA